MAQITQIQVRRDTAANWTSVNPTLSAGEIGFETDTGKFKIGTGSSTWTSLTYATDGSKLTGTIAASTATTATTAGNANTATALATARNINGVSFNGTADITVTATPTAGSVVDASISSTLSPSKITNTAATLTQQRAKFYQGTTTLDVPSRMFVSATTALASGSLRAYFFTPEQDITVTKISNYVGLTAANWSGATTPQAKAALFTVSGSTITPISGAISAWQSSPFTSTTSLYDFTISSTTLTAGTTYAVGMVATWSGTPSALPLLAYHLLGGAVLVGGTILPQISFSSAQTDISGAVTSTAATSTPWYFRLA